MTTFTEKVEELLIPNDNCFATPGEHCGTCLDDFQDSNNSDMNCCSHIKWRDETKQALNEAHQAEISRVLERVKKEANVYNVKSINGELVQSIEDTGVMAVPLEAINKIKGEYSE